MLELLQEHTHTTFGIDISKTNLSLYTLPLAYILAIIPHAYLEVAMIVCTGKWSNTSPRGNVDANQKRLSPFKVAQFKRAQGAHTNGLENLALFFAGVVSSISIPFNVALQSLLIHGPPFSFNFDLPDAVASHWFETLTVTRRIVLISLLFRFIYNPIYIFGTTKFISLLRSTIWFGAQLCSLYLLKLSADRSSNLDSTKMATTFLLPPIAVVVGILGLRVG